MARPRDPRRSEAKNMWLEHNGDLKLVDLAEKVGVTSSTIRKWKATDKWDDELKGSAPKSKRSALNRSNHLKGNQHAAGNAGGAPIKNQNAKGNQGGSAPAGNKNAVRSGEYETIMWDYLDEDEKELFEMIPVDPVEQIDATIRELTIRQRRMMKRIKKVEDGLTERQRRVLQQLNKTKDVHVIERDGVEVRVPVKTDALIVVEIEETEMRAIDDILNIEEALTRVTDNLIKAIKQKHEMELKNIYIPGKHEQLHLSNERLKQEIETIKRENEGTATDDWVGALKEVAARRKSVRVGDGNYN
ncbi:phage terminase small subunit [Jeotgalibacillus sp. ET6]|uniref:phage terminase small subunit n=1 Tax=Jeotgalibacillus sp. ET6 TaxID=3037260 RepID=UPI002418AD31|nr:phage terminase small subunit [Jeotgalibacillus sp. ET6]MDG5470523.1 phage terminase small subunit [Jeotgalibacillus sp. ET6]